jgi:tetratricopeptide (TPR) repeat protein
MNRRKTFFTWLAWTTILAGAVLAQTDEASVLNKYKALESRIEKTRNYFLAENYTKCEKEAAACLEALAEHHGAHFFVAQVLYRRGKFDKALEHMLAAKAGYLHLQAIGESLQQKKFEKQLEKKVDLADQLEDWNSALAQTVCKKGVYQGAVLETEAKLNAANKYSESNPSKVGAQLPAEYSYFHGNCLFRLKKYPEAEEQYKTAIRTDPQHVNAYNNLINLLYMQKRLDEAQNLLIQAEAKQVAIVPGLKKAVLEALRK